MFERKPALQRLQKILSQVPTEAEAHMHARVLASSRFSGNAITQNQEEHNHTIFLRVIKGKKQALVSTNRSEDDAIKDLVARAMKILEHATPDDEILPLITSQPEYQSVDAFYEDTFSASPRSRAEKILEQVSLYREKKMEAAGFFGTGANSYSYCNTRGVSAHHRASRAVFSISAIAHKGKVEGMAEGMDHSLHSLSTRNLGSIAMKKALEGTSPQSVEPGEYDVVLEPHALGELITYLAWSAFSTKAYIEGRSALAGKLGQALFSEEFSLTSTPYNLHYEDRPFDCEGFPTQPIQLIESGVFKELPQDRRTAKTLGLKNTGHGAIQPSLRGPALSSLALEKGEESLDDLIASTERGLFISRFHYTNVIDPMNLSVTGMTRGGVWMIENGKLRFPVRNLRFSENLLKAFKRVDGIGNILEPIPMGPNLAMILPAIKIRQFHFSSTTDF